MAFWKKTSCIFSENYYRSILFSLIVILMVLRAPNVLVHPRFWIEEANTYFRYAYNHPWYLALVTPHLGYFGFLTNLSSILAQLVPLKYAPFVTTYIAFFIQIIPYCIILWGNSLCWNTPRKKIISCLIVLFSPSLAEGMWLTATNSHFHFTLITFLILFEPTRDISALKERLQLILVMLAGLSGPTTVFLTPVFLFAARDEKNRARSQQTLVLSICLLLQIFASMYWHIAKAMTLPLRTFSPGFFLKFFFESGIGMALFGKKAEIFLIQLQRALISNTNPHFVLTLFILLLISVAIIRLAFTTSLLFYRSGVKEIKAMLIKALGSFLCLLIPTMFLWRGELSLQGTRYCYAPNVIFLFFLLTISLYKSRFLKFIAFTLVLISLAFGIMQYRKQMKDMLFFQKSRPDWYMEVDVWQKEHRNPLKIWPEPKTLNLQK